MSQLAHTQVLSHTRLSPVTSSSGGEPRGRGSLECGGGQLARVKESSLWAGRALGGGPDPAQGQGGQPQAFPLCLERRWALHACARPCQGCRARGWARRGPHRAV